MRKPDFFIVGAAKSGTTSIYEFLKAHPEAFLPSVKEPNFFSHKEISAQNLYYNNVDVTSLNEYLNLFEKSEREKVLGESSVSYLFYPECPKRIHAFNPEAKIIIVLRDPKRRAYSHYLMDKKLGFVNKGFQEAITDRSEENKLYYQQFVELGLYFQQVRNYLNVFPKEQVKVYLFEDLIYDTAATLKDLQRFLGVQDGLIENKLSHHNPSLESKSSFISWLYKKKAIRKALKAITPKGSKNLIFKFAFNKPSNSSYPKESENTLMEIYKEDIIKLEELIQRDLSKWYH